MTLTELIEHVKIQYKQLDIESEIFCFENCKTIKATQPKYFYRGESSNYEKTQTTLLRLYNNHKLNLNECEEYKLILYNLYLFLREAIWDISSFETTDHGMPNIELNIAGALQHYGFDTSFIDLTSNINIAANFAAMNKTGTKGKVLILESESLNDDKVNYYFDLTRCVGNRPKVQSSYVLWDQFKNVNLKDNLFLSVHNGVWLDFELTAEDKNLYYNKSILSTKDDIFSEQINVWWNDSSFVRDITSSSLKGLFIEKIKKLNKYLD